jgi:hypothetical protein
MNGSSKSKAFFLTATTVSMWAVGLLLLILLSVPLQIKTVEATRQGRPVNVRQQKQDQESQDQRSPPNFVIVLADDLDWTLGGANASTLSKTRRLVGGESNNNNTGSSGRGGGKTFPNWFVQTPVCCASRAELLTGRVYHNLRVPSMSFKTSYNKGCMHIDVEDDPDHFFWDRFYFSNFFAAGSDRSNVTDFRNNTNTNNYLGGLNYKVGIFGKHLNTHNPTKFLPNGVDEMLINGGGEYLNPTFTHGRRRKINITNDEEEEDYEIKQVKFDNCKETTGMACYSTSVIGNASLAWIRRQVLLGDDYDDDETKSETDQETTTKNKTHPKTHPKHPPFFALISVKAPHIQDGEGFPMAVPAPWYENTRIPEQRAPRTPNYNSTTPSSTGHNNNSNDYHHWLVRNQPPLSDLEAAMVDDLYVSRLKTLLSIDDLVEDLVEELETLGVLDNTYIVFTSDNGYRLGQFRMPQCKLHPYENDVRVPMMIRGPGIGTTVAPPTTTATTKNHQRHHHNNNNNNDNNNIDNDNRHEDSSSSSRQTKRTPTIGHPAAAIFSHVHLMPTLLGLATGMHDSQDILPETMDGTNLARLLLDVNAGSGDKDVDETSYGAKTSAPTFPSKSSLTPTSKSKSTSTSTSLLIEYTSLGNVVRYQHLIDTYNHSFVALRIMPGDPMTTPDNKRAPLSFANKTLSERTAGSTGTSTTTIIENISNLKYIEFRDSLVDWTNTKTPPIERELYDLDQDPYELDNLLGGAILAIAIAPNTLVSQSSFTITTTRIAPSLLRGLEAKTKRLIRCTGDDCRREHSTGLDFDDFDVAPEKETASSSSSSSSSSPLSYSSVK